MKAETCPAAWERRLARERKRKRKLYATPEGRQRFRENQNRWYNSDSAAAYRTRANARNREWRPNLPADQYAQDRLKDRRRQAIRRMQQRGKVDSSDALGSLLQGGIGGALPQ